MSEWLAIGEKRWRIQEARQEIRVAPNRIEAAVQATGIASSGQMLDWADLVATA